MNSCSPKAVQARMKSAPAARYTTQDVFIGIDISVPEYDEPVTGFVCENKDQKCKDYQVRFCCVEIVPEFEEHTFGNGKVGFIYNFTKLFRPLEIKSTDLALKRHQIG